MFEMYVLLKNGLHLIENQLKLEQQLLDNNHFIFPPSQLLKLTNWTKDFQNDDGKYWGIADDGQGIKISLRSLIS